ncbi:MAG: DUF4136 domain-containing protein [Sphingomonadales bacterium]
MKAVFERGSALILAAALVGCTTTSTGGGRPVDVTSFHLGQPIAKGAIAVETFDVPDRGGPEFDIYSAAVARQLSRLGWTVVGSVGQSEQVALVGIERAAYEGPPRRGPVTVGIGGGTGGWNGGVGAGVGFNLGGGPRQIVSTTLQVRIKRRSDQTVIWEGRATAAVRPDRPEGQPAAIADRLAEALFRYFPGESGHTIRLR